MRHFFVDEKPVVGERAILREEDRDHLLRVLRAKEGDVLQIAWNESLFRGTLEIIGGEAFVRVEEAVEEKLCLRSFSWLRAWGKIKRRRPC